MSFIMASCSEKPTGDESKPGTETPTAEFVIVDAPKLAEFDYGQTRTFKVRYSEIEHFDIDNPKGWTVLLDDESLSVTAPDADDESADRKGYIDIIYSGADEVESNVSLAVEVVAAPAPAVTFELRYSEVTATSATLEVIPSDNNVRYYYDVCTEDDYHSVNGDVSVIIGQYIDYLKKAYPSFTMADILNAMLSQGRDSDTVVGLPPSTTMYFYAIAVDDYGNAASEPAVVTFTTEKAGDPSECTFEMTVDDIKGTTVFINIVPSDPSVRYWYAVTPLLDYPGDIPMMVNVKTEAEAYAAEIGMPLEDLIKGVTVAGPVAEYWYDLEMDTQYYLYAFAMDEQGNYLGPCFKEPFKTAATDISDAAIELDYRYFDGDEVYAHDPENYPNVAGRVLVQVKATPNFFATDWAVALGAGDMTDGVTYPDDATINAILASGAAQYNKGLQQFYAEWRDCTIFGFAADANGYNGPLTRILIQPTREGAAPIEELAPVTSVTSACSVNVRQHVNTGTMSFEGRLKSPRHGYRQ